MENQSNDLDVFDFTEADHIPNDEPWRRKLRKPSSDYPLLNNQFIEKASSRSAIETKQALTVELAEDDVVDNSADYQDSPHKDGLNGSEGFNATPDKNFEQHCSFSEGSVRPEIPSSCTPVGLTVGDGDVTPMIQESRVFTGTADFQDAFAIGNIQESSPSVSASEPADNNETIVGLAQIHCIDDLEMDNTDTVIVQTDFIRYSGKYIPASVVLISRESLKVKASTLEGKSVASCSVWNLDDILRIEFQCSVMANVAKVTIRLVPKDAAQAENVGGVSGADVMEFLAHGLEWQERLLSLNLRNVFTYSEKSIDGDAIPLEGRECCSDPYIPNFEEPFEEVVYPKGDIDAVSVSKSDVDLLQPDVFVNDTIIDFYITYLKNEISPKERHRYHFFSSFFFRKLADLDKNPSSISDGKAAFQRVRRWTRKVNIFEKDFVFIPVNYNLHWSLIVLCHLSEVARFKDENIDESSKVPCILHMDSIRGSHAGLKDLLQSYLLEEWKERQKEAAEDICSKFLNLRFLCLELPQQENCSDCGLFLLHYAELFIAEAPRNFSPFLINEFDNFLKPDWFMPAEASMKRVHIQRLIYELLARHSNECASLSGNNLSQCPAVAGSKENDNGIQILSEKRDPEKAWNGNSLYIEPVQGMELGLLGMSQGRVSHYSDHKDLGVTELLEQGQSHDHSEMGMTEFLGKCQSHDQEASPVQLGFATSISGEVKGNGHLAHSAFQTGLQPVDRVATGECDDGYPSVDCNELFAWNSNTCDHRDHGDNSSQDSHFSSDDFAVEMGMFECGGGEQIIGFGQNGDVDQSEEILDSSAGGYASASSDVMETPAEDSQDMAMKYGKSEQQELLIGSQEQLMEACQAKLGKDADDGVVFGDGKLLVEDDKGLDDSLRIDDPLLAKRINPMPSMGNESKVADEVPAGVDDGLVVNYTSSNSEDDQPAKRIQPMPTRGDEIKFEDGALAGLDDVLAVDNSSGDGQAAKRIRPTPTQGDERKVEDEAGAGLDDSSPADASSSDSDDEQPAKRMRCTHSHCEERQLV